LRDFIKRFPKLRGRGKSSFKSYEVKPIPVNLSLIEKTFANGDTVSTKTLLEKKVLNKNQGASKVKILATGELSKKLTFDGVLVSDSAKTKIEKAGGKVA
jgi:large subunit ribosomal protein L15